MIPREGLYERLESRRSAPRDSGGVILRSPMFTRTNCTTLLHSAALVFAEGFVVPILDLWFHLIRLRGPCTRTGLWEKRKKYEAEVSGAIT